MAIETATTSTLSAGRLRAQQHATERAAHEQERAANPRALRSHAELKALAEQGAAELGETDAETVLGWAATNFGTSLTVACSMADAVLPHLVARFQPWVDVLFLDTGYHFSETIGTRDAAEATMQLTIVDVTPKLSVAEQDAAYGERLYERDPTACCAMRKVEPLSRSLGGYEAWVTGVRRDEAPTRANTPLITWDDKNGLVKINPLAAWSFDDLTAYADEYDVLLNPLLSDGYPSIGCAPCTKRVAPGEDPRSGRWAGLDKIECGLHV